MVVAGAVRVSVQRTDASGKFVPGARSQRRRGQLSGEPGRAVVRRRPRGTVRSAGRLGALVPHALGSGTARLGRGPGRACGRCVRAAAVTGAVVAGTSDIAAANQRLVAPGRG